MRVLIIDDDEVDFLATKRLFKKAFPADENEFSWISDVAALDVYTEIDAYDICMVDQNMGRISGIEAIQRIHNSGCTTPTILLTGEHNNTVDELASKYGASDYLVKSELTASLLNRSVRFSIAQKEHEKKLAAFAYTDGLTGLANRIKFDQSIELALATSQRSGNYLALMMVDLDDFKIINDTYGHPAGDALLTELSTRLVAAVRKTDLVARLGGDEFGILITEYKREEDILFLKDKIMRAFERPIVFDDHNLPAAASVGIAVLSSTQKNRRSSDLIRAADGALYKAKQTGKNTFEFFDHALGQTIAKAAGLESALAKAAVNNELELYFQPKVRATDHSVCGAEALLRWNRPDGETIGPATFIPIAERSLSILEIGCWVIEETCRKLRKWEDQGVMVVPIAVNISPIQIQSSSFVSHVEETLEKYQVDPSLLELEITETELMANVELFSDRLEALSAIGCRWVIDDFGVGHSSLSRLKDLPISKIKIDKSFVLTIQTSPSSRKICNIIALLASELDIVLVAEGVESEDQIESLSLLAKDELQGFLFARPLQEEAFLSKLSIS